MVMFYVVDCELFSLLSIRSMLLVTGNMGQVLPEYLSKWTTEKVRKGNVSMFDFELFGISSVFIIFSLVVYRRIFINHSDNGIRTRVVSLKLEQQNSVTKTLSAFLKVKVQELFLKAIRFLLRAKSGRRRFVVAYWISLKHNKYTNNDNANIVWMSSEGVEVIPEVMVANCSYSRPQRKVVLGLSNGHTVSITGAIALCGSCACME